MSIFGQRWALCRGGLFEDPSKTGRTTDKTGVIPGLTVRMAAAARPAGAATRPIWLAGCGRPVVWRGHNREQLAQPRAAAFWTVWLCAVTHQLFGLLATFFARVFVKGHLRFSRNYQRSLGRFMISLSSTACRTPSGFTSMAAICAAGFGLCGAVDWDSVAVGVPPSVPTV